MKENGFYSNWFPTDAAVQAVADDETAFPVMRSLARELIRSRERSQILLGIDDLRREEGASVTIFCDNPEATGPDNFAIEVVSDWTGWQPHRFQGRTLKLALEHALVEKRIRSERRTTGRGKVD